MSPPAGARSVELTERLIEAWRSGRPLAAHRAAHLAPPDDDEAIAVQDAVGTALGWFPDGQPRAWKIASVPPTAAPVPDAFVLDGPQKLKRGEFHTLIGIEVELVLQLARPLPAGSDEHAAAEAIGGVFAAIEIFDVRAEDWRALPRTFLLADQQMHGRLILGSGVHDGWRPEFADTEVCLRVNGNETLRRHGGHALGSPLAILPWLANHVSARSEGLRAGDLIASGTWTGLYEAKPGESIHARFAGIGEVSVDIAAS